MTCETVEPPDWEKIDWRQTPYMGVFLFKLNEITDPINPDVPLFSVFALKVEPGYSIPRHIHKRETGWREQIVFSKPGDFEILRENDSQKVLGKLSVITIKPYEVFGLENHGLQPLFFTSYMKPGFTGYEEIEEVK